MFQTNVVKPNDFTIKQAAALLGSGEVVGIPTETVYGLAANAFDAEAVKKIFLAKGRPQDNPLIVHIDTFERLKELVIEIPDTAFKLADCFWPGPLTMILPKSDAVPDEITGGLHTVAVRMPAHPIARQLIAACDFPLAAPSANLSGSPSPTTAEYVYQDMNGKIPMILDGGACTVGVESTVIAVYPDKVRLLRPGGITAEMLRTVVPAVEIDNGVLHHVANDAKVASPGMKYKHYSPQAHVVLLDGTLPCFAAYVEAHKAEGVYALLYEGEETAVSVPSLCYGKANDPASQAQGLFACLRELDHLGAKTVYARCPDQSGMGLAVYNRLIRAAGYELITL